LNHTQFDHPWHETEQGTLWRDDTPGCCQPLSERDLDRAGAFNPSNG
jgi:hypothetical protein